jgi:hypothetical protein
LFEEKKGSWEGKGTGLGGVEREGAEDVGGGGGVTEER